MAPLTYTGDTGNNEVGGQSCREQNSRAECSGEKKECPTSGHSGTECHILSKADPILTM